MSHQQSHKTSRSSSSDHTFPFQHDESGNHQTLLPDGILNDDDDDDDIMPWPRKSSREDSQDKGAMLKVRQLPQDLTAREFAGLFLMADGFIHADLVMENEEKVGVASFASHAEAEKTRQKMNAVVTGPFSRLSFEITSRGASDLMTPPATLSSSSKSSGSNGSLPQISRLASYVKEKSNETQIGLEDFYGTSSSLPKAGGLSNSVPTNFSTSAGATVWSPTSPIYGIDIGKSPPNGLSMLPPPSSKDDESWNRSGTQNSAGTSRFSQLSINGGHSSNKDNQSQDVRVQQSPHLSAHQGPAMYASIDESMHPSARGALQPPVSNHVYQASSPPKHYLASPAYNAAPNGSVGVFGNHRMGGPAPVNTNPADQNPPCNTLYVGNLPLATTEEELKSLFSRQPGYRRLCYRTKSNGPMCFVEFEDVHYAINSLKLLQGVILSSSIKGGIRLSFSKNPLGVRKMDGGHGHNNNGGIATAPVSNASYNGMHAPPGLQSGQLHGHNHHSHHHHHHHQNHQQQQHHHHQQQQQQQQATVNPIWR